MSASSHSHLDRLFPAPSLPPWRLSPQRLPGANGESLSALQHVLKDNHKRFRISFNDQPFHTHTCITHRALATYALGGPAETIEQFYERDCEKQPSPKIESPRAESITEENFLDHLGDESFYEAYVSFFSNQVAEKGAPATLEKFVLSEYYNYRQGVDYKMQPKMLNRFLGGVSLPLAHVGYGLEFGLRGILAEGLALTAVHRVRVGDYFPPDLWMDFESIMPDCVEHAIPRLVVLGPDTLSDTDIPVVPKRQHFGVHAFDILAQVMKDERLDRKTPVDIANFDHFMEKVEEYMPVIWEYSESWYIDLSLPGEIERTLEEVIWVTSLIYGVGGWTPNGFQPDFFSMRMVTSSLFLPTLIAYLPPVSKLLLMFAHFYTALMWWILRGRPALDIKSFIAATSTHPGATKTPFTTTSTTTTETTTPNPNPFLPVLQSAILHPDDHLVQLQRAFAHFDMLYGRRPAGCFKGTELENVELLDGSLFLRCALLTADYYIGCQAGREGEREEPRKFIYQ